MRVEKMATTLKKNGYTNVFLGPKSKQYLGSFEEVHAIDIGRLLNIVFDPRWHYRWIKKIQKINPDIIIAHDIVAAKVLIDSKLAVVYDDREFWSKSVETNAGRIFTPLYRIRSTPYRKLIPFWERKLVSQFPTLVTNEAVAEIHRRLGKWVGVAWNYPMETMVDNLDLSGERSGVVYSGCDFKSGKFKTHRDMTGLRKFIQFDVICGFTHREMMEKLTRYRVGLTPWHPHPVLPFKDQNRNYEYFHAGLQVVLNEQLHRRFSDCPFAHAFRDYSEISEIITNLPNIDPHDIAEYAKNHYLWKFNEKAILEACEIAISSKK